jgi:hypothetical protein
MARSNVTEKELAELVALTSEAAQAYIRGDMRTYFTLIQHGDDFTLMSPFGGGPERGFDTSPERLEELERFFGGGEAELEIVQTYTSGDLVVLVAIERQHGEVGGLPVVVACHLDLSQRRSGVAAGAPARRPAGPRHQL